MSKKPHEQDAVRTTIVGGRPPGSGRSNVAVPRGIEVLLKKAAVDSGFREMLLVQRGRAAAAIDLQLEPAEDAMLKAIPDEQLELIIRQTTVPAEHRRVFLGQVAVAMLTAIGAGLTGCDPGVATLGVQPDRPKTTSTNAPATKGIRPDPPPAKPLSSNDLITPPAPGSAGSRPAGP